ncbi:hypothetical protein P9112_005985 [Eukaryota sp. TZLM1-RC]
MHSLIPFPDPDQSIEPVCSIVNVTTRSQVPQEETEEDTQEVDPEPNTPETTSSDFIDQNSAHSPAEAFLRKIFNEQKKLLDDDELFSNCVIDEKTGLKLTPDKKIIIPPLMIPEILNHVHGSTEAGHPALMNAWKSLRNSDFFWPFIKRDLEQHVRQCIPCQKNSTVPKTQISSSGSLTQSRRPFEYLHCDTIGPISTDSRKNKYVLHFVDAFSKFSILCPVPDIKSITVADAILSNVYATFGAPRAIHSDNGTEFCNAVFDSLCKLLNITHSTSIPHFHQSNGLVERQHRIILQNLRKVLLDFVDYDNWSDYLPFCQIIANSTFRKSLNASPYELIFGSDTSPRLLPVEVTKSLELRPDQPDVPNYMSSLSKLSLTIKEKWNSVANNTPPSDILPEPKFKPQPGSRVFVLREHPNKLHGHFAGPYIVKKIISRSSLMVENPITHSQLKTSIRLVKPCLSSLPEEILNAYVAADAGELLIDAILDISDDQATILWSDGTQSSQPVDTVKNTVAFQRYSKMMNLDKPRRRRKRKKR